MTVSYKDKLTPDAFAAAAAAYMKIDVINIQVVDGPTALHDGEGYRYVILVCRDANVDQTKASDDLVNKTSGGQGESAGFISAQLGDVPDTSSTKNGATTVAASVGLLCIAGMVAF